MVFFVFLLTNRYMENVQLIFHINSIFGIRIHILETIGVFFLISHLNM